MKISGSLMMINKFNKQRPDGIRAKKSLGQNFCIDERIPNEIITELAPDSNYCVWEIGPGKGNSIVTYIGDPSKDTKVTDNAQVIKK